MAMGAVDAVFPRKLGRSLAGDRDRKEACAGKHETESEAHVELVFTKYLF